MAGKILIVVDMQYDFTYGSLKNQEAIRMIPRVAEKIQNFDGAIIFTQDTHTEDYINTQEGRKLPVPHCIRGTQGWKIVEPLEKLQRELDCEVFEKPTFGSVELMDAIIKKSKDYRLEEVELVGVCTDICVISNAMLLKAALPEITVKVDADCCAGVTPQSHQVALKAMMACQIEVHEE